MVPDIQPPTWIALRETYVFTSETEITKRACHFVKNIISSIPGTETIQEAEARAPGMMIPYKGSMDDVDPRLHEFIRKLGCIVGLHDVAVDENYIIINPNEGSTDPEALKAIDDLIREIWNIVEVDPAQMDELIEEAEGEEWPELID